MDGVQNYCLDAINRCDPEIRKEMYQNVILAGGNTLFEGMSERLW
jgi:actin beta/gamma 1/actin